MSSLRPTLRLNSYRESLISAIKYVQQDSEQLLSALRYGASAPDGVDSQTWVGIVGATRFAYEAGLRDSAEDVAADIRSELAETFSDEELASYLRVLVPDSEVTERVSGTRMRDAFLPNLVSALFVTDLRVVSVANEGGVSAAPVVTARFDFDEHVAGQDALVFQVPAEALDDLIAQLESTRADLRSMGLVSSVTIPRWARGTLESGE